jgi:tetrapyrrole methylase family protein/MazG family protein
VEEELGDLLFAAVKAGRFAGVDGEAALQGACEKFVRRFRAVEALAEGPLDALDVPELETLWRRAKEQET